MIVIWQRPDGQWAWRTSGPRGDASGDRVMYSDACSDARYAYEAGRSTTYGRCRGDGASPPCWCGRPGHVEINVTGKEPRHLP